MATISRSFSREVKGVSIVGLADESFRKRMGMIHCYACEVVAYYHDLLGFYPRRHLVIVPGEQDCSGGYPVGTG